MRFVPKFRDADDPTIGGGPDVMNRFGVAADSRGAISFMFGVPHTISRERALVLAAWIVALADSSDDHADFKRVLDAVEST